VSVEWTRKIRARKARQERVGSFDEAQNEIVVIVLLLDAATVRPCTEFRTDER
jgi:hypothetical protein